MRINSILLAAAFAAASAGASAKTDTLTYDKPAKNADEAIIVGNGTSGATIYGTFPDERVELNHIVAAENPTGENRREAFRPLADLTVYHSVPVGSRVTRYERGMDMGTSTAFTDMTMTAGKRREEFYASAADSVIVISYSDEVPLFCTIFLTSDYAREVKSFDDRITLKGTIPPADGRGPGLDFTTILKVIPGKGNITTNPDASLTLNYMRGATIVISTVKATADVRNLSFTDEGDPATDLARMRVFRASLNLADGLAAYCSKASERALADSYSADGADAAATPDELYAQYLDVAAAGEGGNTQVVLRTEPGRIVFLPGTEAGWGDGEAEDVEALGAFRISFKWEKGKVTGGTITYMPKDYMAKDATVELVLNGESHEVEFDTHESVPLENFVELVRPFIQ